MLLTRVLLAGALGCFSPLRVVVALRRGGTSAASGNGYAAAGGFAVGEVDIAFVNHAGLRELRPRGWRALPVRLGLPSGLCRLVFGFLPTRYLLVTSDHVQIHLWEVAVSILGDPSGRLDPSAQARHLRALPIPDALDSQVHLLSPDRMVVEFLGFDFHLFGAPQPSVLVLHSPFLRGFREFDLASHDTVDGVSPDGEWILMRGRGETFVQNATSGAVRWRQPGDHKLVAFSPSADRIVAVDERIARVLHAGDGRELCRYDMRERGHMQRVAFTARRLEVCRHVAPGDELGREFSTAGSSLSLRVLDEGQACALVHDHPSVPCDDVAVFQGRPVYIHITPDAVIVRSPGDTSMGTRLPTRDAVLSHTDARLPTHNADYSRHWFSPDGGSVLVQATEHATNETLLWLWPFASGRRPLGTTLGLHDEEFRLPRFSDDGQVLVDGRRLLDIASGLEVDVESVDRGLEGSFVLRVSRLVCAGLRGIE